jgi:hypothetical protein
VAGYGEQGTEPSGFTKCGQFPDYLRNLLVSQEGLHSMEVINKSNFCNTVYFKPAATITCSATGDQSTNQEYYQTDNLLTFHDGKVVKA